ncbi:MAG: hypothetical protein AAF734_10465, partial [Bacteroidota bacterium]
YDALYTCLNTDGEVLWEKHYPEVKTLTKTDLRVGRRGFVGKKYKNQLIISPPKGDMFCALDYKTGKLLWEYIYEN